MKAVAFLQNAWSKQYAGKEWERTSWLAALHASRSGQRICHVIQSAPNVEIWWDNTTPLVGNHPDSVIPIDYDHVRNVLNTQKPDMVLVFGKQAAEAVKICTCPIMILPHPAYRVLTNALLKKAGRKLNRGFTGVVKLTQGRGIVSCR